MEFLIISGLSGAGKSRAAGMLEDLDFYCVDNMPVAMIPQFAELCLDTQGKYDKIALVTDIRERINIADALGRALNKVEDLGVSYRILFLEASTSSIVRRYKETRRRHPLDPDSLNVAAAVEKERSLLSTLRGRADDVIDTTDLTLAGLSKRIKTLYGSSEEDTFSVNLRSFGFKYAALTDADIVFDVRFLPNPYYVRELAPLTGLDKDVRDYVMDDPLTEQFMYKFKDFLQFLIPHYAAEGKHALNVAIGCTGGRHRSVAIAAALSDFAAELGYKTSCLHRDIDR